jgi:hypothetical protein
MSIPFLLYWHGSNHAQPGVLDWKTATRAGIGLVAGIALVLLVRHALAVGWLGPGIAAGFRPMRAMPPERPIPLHSTWPLFALNILMGLGWYWLAAVRLVIHQLWSTKPIWGYFLGLSIFLASLSTGLVEDVSRSIGFLFLVVVAASVYEYEIAPVSARTWWRNLLLAGIVTPTIYYTGFSGGVFIPLPIDLGNYLLHGYGGVDLLESLKSWFRY